MTNRLTLTATTERKDGMMKVAYIVNGKVVARIDSISLRPRIIYHQFIAKPKTEYKSWTGAFSWLSKNPDIAKEIVRQVFKDLRSGHNVIIIPVDWGVHQKTLVSMINHQAKINRKKRKEKWPIELARPFNRLVDRKETLNWVDSLGLYENKEIIAKNGRIHKKLPTDSPRVIVSISKMIREGIDLKRPSMLYSIIPLSANSEYGSPQFYQLAMRVCTVYRKT